MTIGVSTKASLGFQKFSLVTLFGLVRCRGKLGRQVNILKLVFSILVSKSEEDLLIVSWTISTRKKLWYGFDKFFL